MKFEWQDGHMETSLPFGKLHISPNEEVGFRPFQLMVASIASCSGSVFHKILGKQKMDYESLSIEAEVDRNEAEANRIEKITLHFTMSGKDLNEKKLQRNLEISRKHCSMIQSVQDSIEIEEKLTVTQL